MGEKNKNKSLDYREIFSRKLHGFDIMWYTYYYTVDV